MRDAFIFGHCLASALLFGYLSRRFIINRDLDGSIIWLLFTATALGSAWSIW
jgi:hypothetical protein